MSPAFAPFSLKPNTGLREIAWLVSAWNTVLPFSWAAIVWMKCSGTRFAGAVLALPGFHRMRHQHAHVEHVALERGADLHRVCHVVLLQPPQPPMVTFTSFAAA